MHSYCFLDSEQDLEVIERGARRVIRSKPISEVIVQGLRRAVDYLSCSLQIPVEVIFK